jgi:hypothetical protein
VIKYLEYTNSKIGDRSEKGNEILQQLSDDIREEVLIDFY